MVQVRNVLMLATNLELFEGTLSAVSCISKRSDLFFHSTTYQAFPTTWIKAAKYFTLDSASLVFWLEYPS